jgi:hypothetical protein
MHRFEHGMGPGSVELLHREYWRVDASVKPPHHWSAPSYDTAMALHT